MIARIALRALCMLAGAALYATGWLAVGFPFALYLLPRSATVFHILQLVVLPAGLFGLINGYQVASWCLPKRGCDAARDLR